MFDVAKANFKNLLKIPALKKDLGKTDMGILDQEL